MGAVTAIAVIGGIAAGAQAIGGAIAKKDAKKARNLK